MTITLEQVSKRYAREWILKQFSYTFRAGVCYGIEGRNGSGKSTLLRLLSGHLSPTRGRLCFSHGQQPLKVEEIYPLLSYVGPYIDLLEELSLAEMLQFHFRCKPLRPGLSVAALTQVLGLEKAASRPISTFSSGMKQRVCLGLALWSDTPLLLLDEPTSTLDAEAAAWFQTQLAIHKTDRLVVIATNDPSDLQQCSERLSTPDFRP